MARQPGSVGLIFGAWRRRGRAFSCPHRRRGRKSPDATLRTVNWAASPALIFGGSGGAVCPAMVTGLAARSQSGRVIVTGWPRRRAGSVAPHEVKGRDRARSRLTGGAAPTPSRLHLKASPETPTRIRQATHRHAGSHRVATTQAPAILDKIGFSDGDARGLQGREDDVIERDLLLRGPRFELK